MSESTLTTAPAASVQTDFEAEERGEARRIGRAIKVLRLRSGLSREAAADRLGTTVEAWAKYERGEVVGIFRPSVQARVVEALGQTVADLAAEVARVIAATAANPVHDDPGQPDARP